jgi:hypothetical protein
MKEKLSVAKVYKSACQYVANHLFAFGFLTVFYFIGSLLPLILGATSLWLATLIYTYLFFYFAAGCYYKQQILWDKEIFMAAGVRFLTAVALFLCALLLGSLLINCLISVINQASPIVGRTFLDFAESSLSWKLGKHLVIFFLMITFFIIPSFAFVSEITGKSRSLLTTYAKTRGNIINIAVVVFIAFALCLVVMLTMSFISVFYAAIGRAILVAYLSILYFKMYDFFYRIPNITPKKKPLVIPEE